MKRLYIISLFIFLFLLSCNKDDLVISPIAEAYLNEVVDVMEANSVNKNSINWSDFRKEVFDNAGVPQNIEQTYQGIRWGLVMLGDHHSFFIKPDGSVFFGDPLECTASTFSAPVVPSTIGYIRINWFSGTNGSDEALAYVQGITDQISTSDQADLLGWIVDLRGNIGGNLWPMMAAIGPILGEGVAGYYIYPDNSQVNWGFSDGSPFLNGNPINQLVNNYQLLTPNPKVAVLLDEEVSKSGEALAISFIGRENTQSFGSSSCGVSNANVGFVLSDNATLVLTVSNMADRNMNTFGGVVDPDVVVDTENIIQSAIDWIEN